MRRFIWVLVTVAVVAALLAGRSAYMEARLDSELAELRETDDPAQSYSGAVRYLESHPNLDEVRLDQVISILTDAGFESGDVDGLIAGLDSLSASAMPGIVTDRLKAELHDALVMRTAMAPTEGDVERADELARELLDATDLRGESYTMMASLRSAMLAEERSSSTHWLTVELAWRGFGLSDAPTRAHEVLTLQGALSSLLGNIAQTRGVDAALASADSILSALPDPTLDAAINADRYALTVDERPELALEYARAVTDARGLMDSWRLANRLAVDIRDRGLDYDLALDLSSWALELAQTHSDSQTVLSTIGWIQHLKGDNQTAREYLERSLYMLVDAPTIEDSAVKRALTVYEEEGLYNEGIDLLATVIARSVEPNEEARARLSSFLALAGRSDDAVSELVAAHRYSGVQPAPEVSFVGSSGEEVSLSDLRGRVVLLCFWSYG